jgi:hypothetical protein
VNGTDCTQGRTSGTAPRLERFKSILATRLKEPPSSLRKMTFERTPDVLDGVGLAGERDLAIWSLDKCFARLRLAWWKPRWTVLPTGLLTVIAFAR